MTVVYGISKIKYLETYTIKNSGTSGSIENYIVTNVKDLGNNNNWRCMVAYSIPASSSATISVYDKDNKLLDTRTIQNTDTTYPLVGYYPVDYNHPESYAKVEWTSDNANSEIGCIVAPNNTKIFDLYYTRALTYDIHVGGGANNFATLSLIGANMISGRYYIAWVGGWTEEFTLKMQFKAPFGSNSTTGNYYITLRRHLIYWR